jgi:hypothetical protein
MPDDILKRQVIDWMVAVSEHIRDCERCRRIYGAAFDAALEALRKAHPSDPLGWIELQRAGEKIRDEGLWWSVS